LSIYFKLSNASEYENAKTYLLIKYYNLISKSVTPILLFIFYILQYTMTLFLVYMVTQNTFTLEAQCLFFFQ